MKIRNYYRQPTRFFRFNLWDATALLLILGIFAILAIGAREMAQPFQLSQPLSIDLHISALPNYALRSLLRMLIAMLVSLLFTFVVGTLAAKSKHAERIILPAIDILQSVPVLGFLSITITGFIALFRGSLLGPECACIFVLFTAQAWNMVLGFYQSLKTVPGDLREASAMFHLSPWQHFWRIEVPLAMPSLIWNMMMSMSASWVFLVASEAISVAGKNIALPGIGSYIAKAIMQENKLGVFYAIIAMFVVIFLYDQLLFRPLLKWSEKFRFDQNPDDKQTRAWVVVLMERTRIAALANKLWQQGKLKLLNIAYLNPPPKVPQARVRRIHPWQTGFIITWYILIALVIAYSSWQLVNFISASLHWQDVWHTTKLGLATLLRVLVSILVSSLIWVPLGVYIGMNPRLTKLLQPIIQFLASFPANLLSSAMAGLILYFDLNQQIWVVPLMVIGAMWYILFNVVAGTSVLSKDYFYATENFSVRGWLWWKRFMLPAIMPYFVTGAITAAGAAWNLSIAVEVLQWGKSKITAYGLGAYLTQYTNLGDFPRIALSISIMCLFILFFNAILWKPLYRLAEKRYGGH